MAFLKENPYEKAFFSTMVALKKALKRKKWEGVGDPIPLPLSLKEKEKNRAPYPL